jgi:RHS repeat-associated protein
MLRRYHPEGRSSCSLVFLPTLALFLCASSTWAQTHQDTITRANSLSGYGGEVTVGGNDGSASYSYPIALPASRGRFQPSLGLYYSSNGSSGPYGVGWSLPLTFIERGVRGSPADASGDPRPQFWLVSNGSRTALVKFPAGQSTHYRSDVANSYLDLINEIKVDPTSGQPLAQTWRASDAHGNQYVFGLAYNRDGIRCEPPAPWFECVRWYLTQVVDVDGNVVNYEYSQEGMSASVLLTHLRYNAYDPSSPNNTNKIGDTGHYATTIDLDYEPEPHAQIEVIGRSLVLHTKRLSRVRINNQGVQAPVTLFTYAMAYVDSPETHRSLLSSIQISGLGGARGPRPTTFTYSARLDSRDLASPMSAPYLGLTNAEPITLATGDFDLSSWAAWIDIDGDKRPDLVWGDGKKLRWAHNKTTASDKTLVFDNVKTLPGSEKFLGAVSFQHPTGERSMTGQPLRPTGVNLSRLIDMNADGRPDLVQVPSGFRKTYLEVQFATGKGDDSKFQQAGIQMDMAGPAADWQKERFPTTPLVPFGLSYSTSDGDTLADIVDLTGDGIPDFVIATRADGWHVFPGYTAANGTWAFATTATKFTAVRESPNGKTPIRHLDENGSTLIDLVDMNGDGLADRTIVILSTAGETAAPTWVVEYNTGAGFKSQPSQPGVPSVWVSGDASIKLIADSPEPPDPTLEENSSKFLGLLGDLNGDGLPDYVYKPKAGEPLIVSWNEGMGFSATASKTYLAMPQRPSRGGSGLETADLVPFTVEGSTGVGSNHNGMLIDADGDGVLDYVDVDFTGRQVYLFAGTTAREANRPDLLTSATSPLLSTTTLHYAPSTTFESTTLASVYPVLVKRDLTGPKLNADPDALLEHSSTVFWYASAETSASWDDPARQEFLGFKDSWSQDSTTGIVEHSTWSTINAFAGSPSLVELGVRNDGAVEPGRPAWTALTPFRKKTFNWQARTLGTNSFSDHPSAGDYPVIAFPAVSQEITIENGEAFTSQTSIDWNQVDQFGNIHEVKIDKDDRAIGDEYTVHTTYDGSAACKSCPVEMKTSVVDSTGTRVLADSFFRYDAPSNALPPNVPHPNILDQVLPRLKAGSGHLNFVERWLPGAVGVTPDYEVASATSFNGNGTVGANNQILPPVNSTIEYDSYQLRVVRTTVSDNSIALVNETTYDQETGRPILVRGPYVRGSIAAMPQRAFAYDQFGRIVAIAREPIRGTVAPKAIAAFEYRDRALPNAIITYSFATPINLTLGAIPIAASEVNQSISYLDALGRIIQTRETLAADPPTDSRAQIVQTLDKNRFRVSQAVLLDGAGRVKAQLDPFYSSNFDFQNYRRVGGDLDTPGLHASIVAYDPQSRPVSSAYLYISGEIPSQTSGYMSDFSDDANYKLATLTSYGVETVDGRKYLYVDILAARENIPNGPRVPTRQYYDASARLVYARDPFNNLSHVVYDPLSRPIATERRASPPVPITMTSTVEYDTLGRIIKKVDPDFGTRIFRYLPSGQLAYTGQNPTSAAPDGVIGVKYLYDSLGRLTEVQHVLPRRPPERVSRFLYDQSYSGQFGSGSYEYTAGRMTAAISDATTIAFGYNEDGVQTRRDQWFNGLPGPLAQSVLRELGNDGRLLSTTVSLPEGSRPRSFTYRTRYDSAGRPVRVDNGDQVFFEAPAQPAGTGAYDALGRLSHSQADNGQVSTDQVFSPFTNMPTSQKVSLPRQQLFSLDRMQYAGPNLTGHTDVLTGTSFSMEYDCDGWLSRATASASGTSSGNSALGQRYDQSFSHFLNKIIGKTCARQPTLDNLEHIVDTGQPGRTVDQTYHYDYFTQPAAGVRSIDTLTESRRGQSVKTDTYAYDGDNRGLLISHNGSEGQFLYDAENRLTQIKRTTGESETLGYDAFGALAKRVITTPRPPRDVATATTLYYVGSDATVVQTNVGRSEPAVSIQPNVHILLEGVRIASVRNTFAPRLESSQSILYYHRDRLGSVVATSLAGGKPGASYRYTPYGALDVSQGVMAETESELGYTGARRLSGDLVNLNARVYDPRMRRFLQPDDVDIIRYTYVAGDPINRTDPTGHQGHPGGWHNQENLPNRGGSYNPVSKSWGTPDAMWLKLAWLDWYRMKGHMSFDEVGGAAAYFAAKERNDLFYAMARAETESERRREKNRRNDEMLGELAAAVSTAIVLNYDSDAEEEAVDTFLKGKEWVDRVEKIYEFYLARKRLIEKLNSGISEGEKGVEIAKFVAEWSGMENIPVFGKMYKDITIMTLDKAIEFGRFYDPYKQRAFEMGSPDYSQ